MAGVLIRGRHVKHGDTGRMPCDDKGRDWSYVAASQEMPKIVSKPLEARKRQGRIVPYRFQREHGPAKTLISDFWLPEL